MFRTSKKFNKITALTTVFTLISSTAFCLPTGGSVVNGNAAIVNSANTTNINQTSHGATINWATFGSNAGETINFNQPNTTAYTINKVTTAGVPSILAGALNANGHVVVMNNAGVTFAQGGQVNVGSLTATTANNINVDANDNMTFSGISNAPIVNDGTITAARGGYVAIQAANVTNNGNISAERGGVGIGATDGMTVTADGKINYQPGTEQAQSIITNNGNITANGGEVLITNQQAQTIAQSVINLNGVVDVSCLDCNGGPNQAGSGGVVQVASAGDINSLGTVYSNGGALGTGGTINMNAAGNLNVGGTVTANGGSTSGNGGNVTLRGNNFAFQDTSNVDASATSGVGGNITIGSANDVHIISNGGNGTGGVLNAYNKGMIGVNSQKGVNTEIDGHNIIVDDMQSAALNGGDGNIAFKTVDQNGNLFADGSVKFITVTDTINTRSGSVNILAGSGGINIGNLTSTGDATHVTGTFNLTTQNGGDVVANNITTFSPNVSTVGGQLVISSDHDVTINGAIYLGDDDLSTLGNGLPTVTGSIIAKNNVTLNGQVQVIAIDNYRPDIHPTASLYVEAGGNGGTTGSIVTNGKVFVNAIGNSSRGNDANGNPLPSNGNDYITANAQFTAKDSILATQDIYVLANGANCIAPVTANSNLSLIATNGNVDTSKANILAQSGTTITGSVANSVTTINALNGTASIGAVGTISSSTCCTGLTGRSTGLTTVYAKNINFDGVDPYSEANYMVEPNITGQLYQARVSGYTTNGNDRAEVRINQTPPVVVPPPVTPPATCQDNCNPTNPIPLVNLPPSTIANLEPAAGGGNFCENVNISSLPGLCYPEAPHVVELAPAAGPIPFHFGTPTVAKHYAELKPKSGRCVNVTKPGGGKDTVCIKDEIDK